MTDLEKVIKGLEWCLSGQPKGFGCDRVPCPYNEFADCEGVLHHDALALLKAHEPIEARLHLCESCAKEYPECDATVDGIEFGSGVGNDNIIGCTAYVNRWTSNPTDAQMEAEPWYGE